MQPRLLYGILLRIVIVLVLSSCQPTGAAGTIRGADLTNLLRYKPPQAPNVFP